MARQDVSYSHCCRKTGINGGARGRAQPEEQGQPGKIHRRFLASMFESLRKPTNSTWAIIFISFLLVGIAFVWISNEHRANSEYARNAANQNKADAERNFYSDCEGHGFSEQQLVDCLREKIAAAPEPQRAQEDLQAQKEMVFWAMIAAVGAIGLGFITWLVAVLGLVYAKRAWDEARESANAAVRSANAATKSNKIARKTAMRQLRAYLKAVVVDVHTTAGDEIVVTYKVQNYGQTPARKVATAITVVVRKRDWRWEDEQACPADRK